MIRLGAVLILPTSLVYIVKSIARRSSFCCGTCPRLHNISRSSQPPEPLKYLLSTSSSVSNKCSSIAWTFTAGSLSLEMAIFRIYLILILKSQAAKPPSSLCATILCLSPSMVILKSSCLCSLLVTQLTPSTGFKNVAGDGGGKCF